MDKQNINTQDTKELIELRSDNIRRFIDEEPPLFIRYGTIAIILLLVILATIIFLAFLFFEIPKYDSTSNITDRNHKRMKNICKFNELSQKHIRQEII